MNPRTAQMAAHFGAEVVDLRRVEFTEPLLACVPAKLVLQCRVLPVFDGAGTLTVAIADLSDLASIDSLHSALHRDIEICVADETQMEEFIVRLYGTANEGDG